MDTHQMAWSRAVIVGTSLVINSHVELSLLVIGQRKSRDKIAGLSLDIKQHHLSSLVPGVVLLHDTQTLRVYFQWLAKFVTPYFE